MTRGPARLAADAQLGVAGAALGAGARGGGRAGRSSSRRRARRGMPGRRGARRERQRDGRGGARRGHPDRATCYVDPLVFPVSVDGAFGRHCLDAIRELRARFGPDIHITGGMSNVSFGIPGRRLINDVFLRLAVEAGADSGIIDPIAIDVGRLADPRPRRRAVRARARRADGRRRRLPRVPAGLPGGGVRGVGAAPPARKAS